MFGLLSRPRGLLRAVYRYENRPSWNTSRGYVWKRSTLPKTGAESRTKSRTKSRIDSARVIGLLVYATYLSCFALPCFKLPFFTPPEVPVPFLDLEDYSFLPRGDPKTSDTKYRPLLYRNDIRLLVLHPAKYVRDDIHFHLEHVSLAQRDTKYEALSYVWGSEATTHVIFEAGEPVQVRQNLHAALQNLRYSNRHRILWIDALCIDQNDLDERSQQVRLMGDVFSEADRVIVWLGELTNGERTKAGLTAIQVLKRINFNFYQQSQKWRGLYVQFSKAKGEAVLRRLVNGASIDQISWKPIQTLLSRPWFHRLWVYQEVANAKCVVVAYGNYEVPWTELSGALSYLWYHNLDSKYLDAISTYACTHVAAMEMTRTQKLREPLFNAILAGSQGACSDPRDKVFAVMSVADGKDIFDWEVSFDYSLSLYDLFRRFAIWDILRWSSLRSLSCATIAASDTALPSHLPSWAPDWTQTRSTNLLVRWVERTGFRAAGSLAKDVWFTNNMTLLHAKGSTIGRIQTIGSHPCLIRSTSLFEIDKTTVQQLRSMREWILECWCIAAAGQPMTPATYKAFWSTMICGLTANAYPVPSVYSKYFLGYMRFLREAPEVLDRYLQDERSVQPLSTILPAQLFVDPHSRQLHHWFNQSHTFNVLIEDSLHTWSLNRRFCRTDQGLLARVPDHAKVGDIICILYGSQVPYVLREQGDEMYKVIGECYVHGMMHGEGLQVASHQSKIFRIR